MGIRFTEGGMDMDGMRKPAGSVSMEPAIMPSPAPPSRALNLLRHDGERRKDLSSPLYKDEKKRGGQTIVGPRSPLLFNSILSDQSSSL